MILLLLRLLLSLFDAASLSTCAIQYIAESFAVATFRGLDPIALTSFRLPEQLQ
jgi:hypothetical protein